MSLPIASQNTQHYLQASYGLACAVASAEMALFAEALFLRFDHLEALSLRFDHAEALSFAVQSFGGIVFAVQSWRRRSCHLRLDQSEVLPLQFDIAVRSFGYVVICGSIIRRRCLCVSTTSIITATTIAQFMLEEMALAFFRCSLKGKQGKRIRRRKRILF
jgi:hypothetical protein